MKKFASYFLAFAVVGLVIGDHFLLEKIKSGTTVVVKNEQVAPERQVVTLPNDGNQYFTTLFLPSNWQADNKCRNLVANFQSDPRLSSLKVQTRYNQYEAHEAIFTARYAASVTELPCVALTDSAGGVVYKASGVKIPNSPRLLAQAIQSEIVAKRCPNGKCPWQDDEEKPDEKIPDTTPVTPVTPVVDPVEPDKHLPLWIALIAGAAGVALGVGPDIAKKYKALG